jgi:hypothetical protein
LFILNLAFTQNFLRKKLPKALKSADRNFSEKNNSLNKHFAQKNGEK